MVIRIIREKKNLAIVFERLQRVKCIFFLYKSGGQFTHVINYLYSLRPLSVISDSNERKKIIFYFSSKQKQHLVRSWYSDIFSGKKMTLTIELVLWETWLLLFKKNIVYDNHQSTTNILRPTIQCSSPTIKKESNVQYFSKP